MKGLNIYALAAATLLTAAATGCTEKDPGTTTPDAGTRITLRTADYETSGGSVAGEVPEELGELDACLFDAGEMVAVYKAVGAGGFDIDRTQGTLYVVAGVGEAVDLEALLEAGISEEQWLATDIGTADGKPRRFLSGKVALTGAAEARAELTRGVARLDLQIRTADRISVGELSFRNAALCTGLFAEAGDVEEERGEVTFRPDTPYSEDTPGAAFLYEQSKGAPELTLRVQSDSREYELTAELPATLRRNHVYVATLTQEEINGQVRLTVEAWGAGEDTDLQPDLQGRIVVNDSRSVFPEGVAVDADRTGISLPYGATELLLALDCSDELELQPVEGYPLTVEQEPAEASLEGKHRYRIRKALYAPGMQADEVALRFRRKGFEEVYPEDCIVLRLPANPTRIEGAISFDAGSYAYDFGRYVDNELGRLTLPEGKELLVEFDNGEDPWIRLAASEENARTIRVVAGWKPNDPTADGRVQAATLVIRNAADGSAREEYRVSRRNYGLPVTWLHGVWWCKYNARGNSRSFDDQVLSAADPAEAAGKSVQDYLRDCSPEEFYDLWGWAYQGDSGSGMRVVDLNGVLVMEGFSTGIPAHINKLPADALAPDGYEIPSMEEFNRIFDATDYVWVMWGGTHRLRNPWEGHSIVKREQRRRNDIVVGSVAATDLLYTAMSSPDYPQHEAVTWYGPGAQWNADGIRHANHYNNILFAVHAPDGSGWYFAGSMAGLYLHKNGAGNNDTRILRFKKSPVEYIYGE